VTRFLPVAGTHAWRGQQTGRWWQHPSPWLTYMEGHGCVPYNAARPFVWSTNLDGWRFISRRGKHYDWQAAGHNLYAYLVPPLYGGDDNGVGVSGDETRIVAHSHGLQVVLYACALGLRVRTLVSVGSPVREDMADVTAQARPNIGFWLHLHSDGSDRMQWLGTLGDGRVGVLRGHPEADRNGAMPKVGHSGVLQDADAFALWEVNGWLDTLRS
jgi:hypothetical protein